MSAHLLSATHIGFIAAASRTLFATRHTPEQAAETLARENVRSVAHRYEETEEQVAGSVDGFVAECQAEAKRAEVCWTLSPVQILKAAQQLAYHSCEHTGWVDSPARQILDSLTVCATRKLPGYGEAALELPAGFTPAAPMPA